MADRQDGHRRRDVARRGRHALAGPAVGEVEVLDAQEEAHLAAQLLDLAAERLHHGGQAVAAQVRPVVVEDGRLARLRPCTRRTVPARGSTSGPVPRQVSLPSLKVPAPPSPKR